MNMEPQWLRWAKQLQAIAQSGLTFAQDPYDIERYQALKEIALNIMAQGGNTDITELRNIFQNEIGYCTPKIDVRGAAFEDQKILLVRERSDALWTLPGGWGEVGLTASENVEKEFLEESGYRVKTIKLAAVYDRAKQGHVPPHPYDVYKLFFICNIIGGAPKINNEISEIGFFSENGLPELSLTRTMPVQIARMFKHYRNPSLPVDYD
jgi:ADP-ribose pyrophosphatase YjhB (NUDIX family)